jgi:16S rRNA (cytidine1402-2'-O)-methyltransferase
MSEEPAPATLYLVGTPIGNVGDLSPRALRILGAVDLIAAEDTRHTRGLLSRFGLDRPMVSYHDHNKESRTPELIERLRGGASIAVVSDAGSPGISDPAFTLVRAAVEEGIPAVPIPGPSSLLCALEVSGLPTDRFSFEGFLPRRPGRRRARIAQLRDDPRTVIFFESPYRLSAALGDLLEVLGDRRASVSRELTKKFEETRRGLLSELLAWAGEKPPRGEFVLVVAGAGGETGSREERDAEGAEDAEDAAEAEEEGVDEPERADAGERWTDRTER